MPIDAVFALFAAPSALILLAYRRIGSARLPWTTRLLKTIGLFPIRKHYYEPLFDDSALTRPLSEERELPGIDFDMPAQLEFLNRLTFSRELLDMDWKKPSAVPNAYCIENGSFEGGDADFLYQFVREVKPDRIIEIGSGNSTKVARLALLQNAAESGRKATHTCIEPYEMGWLESLGDISVLRQRVEDSTLDWGHALSSGDLLFVDSSHIIRPQGDVLHEYLEIFPQLASGVYIHIHDIFTPRDYLRSWVVDEVRLWNEQYLLEALLSNTDRYQVVASVNFLKHRNFDALQRVCPYLAADREPGSFYIRVR
jgi:hypothetical protein